MYLKKKLVYSHNQILSDSIKEWSTDAWHIIDEPQNNYTQWKKPDNQKRISTVGIYVCKTFENLL